MQQAIKMWKHKLEHEIKDYTACEVTPESLEITERLGRNWMLYADLCKRMSYTEAAPQAEEDTSQTSTYRLTEDEIFQWNARMENSDGSIGGHWTEDQTSALARTVGVYFEHLTALEWNVTCNMIYSDYYMVAQSAGVDTPDFYGQMAKAFLFDRDGPGPARKLCAYYHYIVSVGR